MWRSGGSIGLLIFLPARSRLAFFSMVIRCGRHMVINSYAILFGSKNPSGFWCHDFRNLCLCSSVTKDNFGSLANPARSSRGDVGGNR